MTTLLVGSLLLPVGVELSFGEREVFAEEEKIEESTGTNQQEAVEPVFSFAETESKGNVGEIIFVTIVSTEKVQEVSIHLPEEATIVKENLPVGLTIEKLRDEGNYLVESDATTTTFELPIAFEEVGTYEIFAEDSRSILRIENSEENLMEDEGKGEFSSTFSSNLVLNPTLQFDPRTSTEISNWELIETSNPIGALTRNVKLVSVNHNQVTNLSVGSFTLERMVSSNMTRSNQRELGRMLIFSQTINTVPNAKYNLSLNLGTVYTGPWGERFAIVTAHDGVGNVAGTGASELLLRSVSISEQGEKGPFSFTSSGSQTTISIRTYDHATNIFNVSVTAEELRLSTVASPVNGGTPRANTNIMSPGQTTTITANPNSSHNFVRWEIVSGSGSSIANVSSANTTFTMGTTAASIRAIYESKPQQQLSMTASPTGAGSPSASKNMLVSGETTTITANPNSSHNFVRWEIVSGTGSSIANVNSANTTFTMGSSDTTIQAVYERKQGGAVTVQHIDEADNTVLAEEVLNGLVDEEYETSPEEIAGYTLVKTPENASGKFKVESQTVTYVYKKEKVNPVDPLDPDVEVDPENKPELPEEQGRLSIDFISQFDFGKQHLSAQDQTYYARPQRLLNEDGTVNEKEERPNYLQISDRRAENERNGWQLSVRQNSQFKNDKEHELMGASLALSNHQLVSVQGGEVPGLHPQNTTTLTPGSSRVLVRAEGNEGTGTWIYRFGDGETANESVALFVPKGATPHASTYSTKLTWQLSMVPGN